MVSYCTLFTSAMNGENLAVRSEKMPWYKGPTLLESLDGFRKAPPKSDRPLRMPVQAIYKFTSQGDDRRIEKAGDKPFLVWYAPMLPHDPHNPPADLLEKYLKLAPSDQLAAGPVVPFVV